MKRLSRSSRATGPKIRVPRGSPSAFKITAAFSSNLKGDSFDGSSSLSVVVSLAVVSEFD
jgi:hypothetical protein